MDDSFISNRLFATDSHQVILDNCGSRVTAMAFCLSFYLISAFVLLSLLVAIVLSNFRQAARLDAAADLMNTRKSIFKIRSDSQTSPSQSAEGFRPFSIEFIILPELVQHFNEVWMKYDSYGDSFIPYVKLFELVRGLQFPLGYIDHPCLLSIEKSQLDSHVAMLSRILVSELGIPGTLIGINEETHTIRAVISKSLNAGAMQLKSLSRKLVVSESEASSEGKTKGRASLRKPSMKDIVDISTPLSKKDELQWMVNRMAVMQSLTQIVSFPEWIQFGLPLLRSRTLMHRNLANFLIRKALRKYVQEKRVKKLTE